MLLSIDIDPAPTTAWLALAIAVLTISGIVLGAIRYIIRQQDARLTRLIKQQNLPIQPTSNGGLSLPDLHGKVDLVIARQGDIQSDIEGLVKDTREDRKRLNDHLDHHERG